MSVLMGSSAAGVDAANSNASGIAFAVRLQCTASGTVDFLYVKSANGVSAAQHGALYADNAGSLASASRLSADITSPTAVGGWHRYTVSPGVAVTSGTFYWLEFLNTSITYNYTDNAASGGTTRDTNGLTTLAATHPATSANFTNIFNAYADGTLTGGVTQVSSTRLLKYDILNNVASTRLLKWDLANLVASVRQLKWDILNNVSSTRQLKWDLAALVSSVRRLVWDVGGNVVSTRKMVWDILNNVASTRLLKWDLANLISSVRALKWDILNNAASTRLLKWDTAALVSSVRALQWDVNSAVAAIASAWRSLMGVGR